MDRAAFLKAQREDFAKRVAQRKGQAKVELRDQGLIAAANRKPDPFSVDGAIESQLAIKALQGFCESEHSEESLLFMVEASAWRARWATSSPEQRREGANALIAKFVVEGSPQEICVPAKVPLPKVDDELSAVMFDTCMKYARITLIQDIWPRFEDSPAGGELKKQLASEDMTKPTGLENPK